MTATAIPILPSADFDRTARFWAAFGFAEAARWEAEYLILRHAGLGVELHFWHQPAVDRWTNDVACFVRFDSPGEAAAWHAEWAGVVVPEPSVLNPPATDPEGAIEFQVIDLDGNLVRFGGFPASWDGGRHG